MYIPARYVEYITIIKERKVLYMKKVLVLLMLVLMVCGCGVTQEVTDGSDGSNGSSGQDGRDYITPLIRPHSFTADGKNVMFDDVSTATKPMLSMIGFGTYDEGNFISIRVPSGNAGKRICVVINGTLSDTVTVPDNTLCYAVFDTNSGTSDALNKRMDSSRIDRDDKNSYIAWYLEGISQEFYFSDTFKQ